MSVKLSAEDLRALATLLDLLTDAQSETGLAVGSYGSFGVEAPGWTHSLDITRDISGDAPVFVLVVSTQ